MSSTSRIPAVISALVSTFTTAMPTATVYDGQWLTTPDGDYLTVGWTPNGEQPTGHQQWDASLGNKARGEEIDIPCYVDSYSGDTDTATRRNAAFALLAAAENALRADLTLGGAVPQPGYAELGSYELHQEQTEAGLAVGVIFHVLVTTRI